MDLKWNSRTWKALNQIKDIESHEVMSCWCPWAFSILLNSAMFEHMLCIVASFKNRGILSGSQNYSGFWIWVLHSHLELDAQIHEVCFWVCWPVCFYQRQSWPNTDTPCSKACNRWFCVKHPKLHITKQIVTQHQQFPISKLKLAG